MKIWESETEYYEFEKKDSANFVYVMEKIQQLPHNVKIPPEKLEALAQVSCIPFSMFNIFYFSLLFFCLLLFLILGHYYYYQRNTQRVQCFS
jgi:hypothetical protein